MNKKTFMMAHRWAFGYVPVVDMMTRTSEDYRLYLTDGSIPHYVKGYLARILVRCTECSRTINIHLATECRCGFYVCTDCFDTHELRHSRRDGGSL